MILVGLFAYVFAIWFASRGPHSLGGNRLSALAAFGLAAILCTPFLFAWVRHGGGWHAASEDQVQLAFVAAYGLLYALVPSALVRPWATRAEARVAGALLAMLLPWVCVGIVAALGDRSRPVHAGNGHLEDLLFLDPVEMGEGVTHDGLIPHRIRVHSIALAALAAAAVVLRLVVEVVIVAWRRALSTPQQDE